MGALPKRNTSTHRKGRRRATISLTAKKTVPCWNCGKPRLPHIVCPHCGAYKKA